MNLSQSDAEQHEGIIGIRKQGEKTKLTLRHYDLPEGHGDEYRKGWEDFYVEPMQQYFNRKERKLK